MSVDPTTNTRYSSFDPNVSLFINSGTTNNISTIPADFTYKSAPNERYAGLVTDVAIVANDEMKTLAVFFTKIDGHGVTPTNRQDTGGYRFAKVEGGKKEEEFRKGPPSGKVRDIKICNNYKVLAFLDGRIKIYDGSKELYVTKHHHPKGATLHLSVSNKYISVLVRQQLVVSKWDKKTITPVYTENLGFKAKNVTCIAMDETNLGSRIAIAVVKKGVYVFDETGSSGEEHFATTEKVDCLKFHKNELLMGTDSGLFSLNEKLEPVQIIKSVKHVSSLETMDDTLFLGTGTKIQVWKKEETSSSFSSLAKHSLTFSPTMLRAANVGKQYLVIGANSMAISGFSIDK